MIRRLWASSTVQARWRSVFSNWCGKKSGWRPLSQSPLPGAFRLGDCGAFGERMPSAGRNAYHHRDGRCEPFRTAQFCGSRCIQCSRCSGYRVDGRLCPPHHKLLPWPRPRPCRLDAAPVPLPESRRQRHALLWPSWDLYVDDPQQAHPNPGRLLDGIRENENGTSQAMMECLVLKLAALVYDVIPARPVAEKLPVRMGLGLKLRWLAEGECRKCKDPLQARRRHRRRGGPRPRSHGYLRPFLYRVTRRPRERRR